ncbi:hypothetical protein PMAYCL1PPCAC_30890, partial [Pristionchus mayeri]
RSTGMLLLFVLFIGAVSGAINDAKMVHYRLRRQAIIANATNIWSTSDPIPYFFESGVQAVSAEVRQQILAAITFWQETTCLNFKEDTTRSKGIKFISGPGCFSTLGRWPYGTQSLSLYNQGCNNMATALHEMEHALGVNHQMSRLDRDSYLRVHEDRIQGGIVSQYQKKQGTQTFGLPYEYGSVMHYTGGSAAKVPGQATMEALNKDYQQSMGGQEPSFLDVQIVNLLYKCTMTCRTQLQCKNFGYTHPKKCNVCICPEGWGGAYCDQIPAGAVSLSATANFQTYNINFGGAASNRSKSKAHVITAPAGKRIEVKFPALKTTNMENSCGQNGIEWKGKTDLRTRGVRFCGWNVPTKSYVSEGNRAVINAYYYSGSATATVQYRF